MKEYTIYFIIKKNGHGYMNQETVAAKNKAEAIRLVKANILENTGRNAFQCTTKQPVIRDGVLEYNGMLYTRYSDLFHTLW
jgi:hypothetical protein